MKRRPLVYVAGPYTTPEPHDNVKAAIEVGSAMLGAGLAPIVPHLSHYWHLADPHPYEDWLALDFEIIRRVDHLYRMPGVSPGADREVAFARDECAIPVWIEGEHGTLDQFVKTLVGDPTAVELLDDAKTRQAYAAELEREADQR